MLPKQALSKTSWCRYASRREGCRYGRRCTHAHTWAELQVDPRAVEPQARELPIAVEPVKPLQHSDIFIKQFVRISDDVPTLLAEWPLLYDWTEACIMQLQHAFDTAKLEAHDRASIKQCIYALHMFVDVTH